MKRSPVHVTEQIHFNRREVSSREWGPAPSHLVPWQVAPPRTLRLRIPMSVASAPRPWPLWWSHGVGLIAFKQHFAAGNPECLGRVAILPCQLELLKAHRIGN